MSSSQSFHEASRLVAHGHRAIATLKEVDIRSELQFRSHLPPDDAAKHAALTVLAMEIA